MVRLKKHLVIIGNGFLAYRILKRVQERSIFEKTSCVDRASLIQGEFNDLFKGCDEVVIIHCYGLDRQQTDENPLASLIANLVLPLQILYDLSRESDLVRTNHIFFDSSLCEPFNISDLASPGYTPSYGSIKWLFRYAIKPHSNFKHRISFIKLPNVFGVWPGLLKKSAHTVTDILFIALVNGTPFELKNSKAIMLPVPFEVVFDRLILPALVGEPTVNKDLRQTFPEAFDNLGDHVALVKALFAICAEQPEVKDQVVGEKVISSEFKSEYEREIKLLLNV